MPSPRVLAGSGVCEPDRFGPDNREVCAATCARRGCTGCCFCVGVRLPVYLEIHTGESLRCNQTAACGLAAGGAFELQIGHSGARPKDGDSETASPRLPYPGCLTQAASSARAVPAYLLDRQTTRQRSWGTVLDDLSLGCGSDLGRVIYLPGAGRSHVAADQLVEYTERLACSGALVEILSGDSCECTLGPDVLTRRDAHHSVHAGGQAGARCLRPAPADQGGARPGEDR